MAPKSPLPLRAANLHSVKVSKPKRLAGSHLVHPCEGCKNQDGVSDLLDPNSDPDKMDFKDFGQYGQHLVDEDGNNPGGLE